ncbi:MAG TPA: zinc ribbon domain-containing protein [Candidatus Saccharimonadales bacterium]|jgi:hypothetical protein|nr:zinc ribbon domain-containing protein [Candidatus Saccharimonadales bacterium]
MENTSKQDFWKPALAPREPAQAPALSCPHCGIGLAAGSRFCHACGDALQSPTAPPRIRARTTLASVRDSLGQTTLSLICLLLGAVCAIAALVTGFFFSASTLLDWQAVQIWRIEWLLAANASFVAGILVKKNHITGP